jgi:integrase
MNAPIRPYELDEDGIFEQMDALVQVTFDDLTSQFMLLPKGGSFAVETLRRTLEARGAHEADVIFPSAAGTLRSPANFRRQWREARRGAGFERVTPHSFRETVATLLDRERTTADAAAQLGHSSPAATRTHYIQKAHEAPDMAEVLQQLGRPAALAPVMSL